MQLSIVLQCTACRNRVMWKYSASELLLFTVRTCHNGKQKHYVIGSHLVELPSKTAMGRDNITHNLRMIIVPYHSNGRSVVAFLITLYCVTSTC